MRRGHIIVCAIAVAGLLFLYGWADPATSAFFPGCPFKKVTGLDCPGCGSQRALHHLLRLDLANAFGYNPLLVVAIPYMAGSVWFEARKKMTARQRRWREALYGLRAIYVVLAVILLFTVFRNIS